MCFNCTFTSSKIYINKLKQKKKKKREKKEFVTKKIKQCNEGMLEEQSFRIDSDNEYLLFFL